MLYFRHNDKAYWVDATEEDGGQFPILHFFPSQWMDQII